MLISFPSHEKRDAPDILKILTDYADAGNEDRLYADELPILEAAEFDVPIAGARLLGKDAPSHRKSRDFGEYRKNAWSDAKPSMRSS